MQYISLVFDDFHSYSNVTLVTMFHFLLLEVKNMAKI